MNAQTKRQPPTLKRRRRASLRALVVASMLTTSAAAAQDLALDASTTPPPPWTPFQPVQLVLSVRNHGSVPAQAFIELDGMRQSDGLVRMLRPDPGTVAACFVYSSCMELLPNPDNLLFCINTPPIAPGAAQVCRFDVVAFPDASGSRTVRFSIFPYVAPNSPASGDVVANNSVALSFQYGAPGVSFIPTLGAVGLTMLGLCIVAIARISFARRSAT